MKRTYQGLLAGLLLGSLPQLASAEGVSAERLLGSAMASAPGREVIVSRVSMPPHTSLPKHWHPGEEYAYVIEGSTTLWQEGKEDTVVSAGEAVLIPLQQVHTAITGDEGATILVFRVHESGKPERYEVD